jgi:hypothetical protein
VAYPSPPTSVRPIARIAVVVLAVAATVGLLWSSFPGPHRVHRLIRRTAGLTPAFVHARLRSVSTEPVASLPSDHGPPSRAVGPPTVDDAPATAARSGSSIADVEPYRGLGTWVDLYDRAWEHPGTAVRRMRARGVRTLYLETSNFSRPSAFVYPDGVARFLDAARRHGIDVVAWYLPGLVDPDRDYRRSMAAIRLRTANGGSFSSFALDIEAPDVRDPHHRTARLLRLSARIRRSLDDPTYPLGAIIPSPRRLQTDPSYWPVFPYARLERSYDVFLPMTYFTWRVHGRAGARWYTTGNIRIIRRQTGDRTVPIHVIGGIGGAATRGETAGFVSAVRERDVIGASYYTFPITSDDDWAALSKIQQQRP